MALRSSKLCARIVVSSVAVLIFLSVASSAEEATRCYWCGPLAEQVHRSQRAPSCSIFDLEQHQTVCDKGYTHCATVATSPPYAESRLCVKFYQDECYSLYCNSTKTWRMVCACRGDLCNGHNTDRETKAFALVPKFLSKTSTRNKRSPNSGFISVKTKTPADNNTIIIINNITEHASTINSLQNDQPEQAENTNNGNTTQATHINDMHKKIEDNIIVERATVKDDESGITHTSPSIAETSDESKMPNGPVTVTATDDNAKMDKPTNLNLDHTTPAEIVTETHGPDVNAFTTMKTTNIATEPAVVHNSVTPGKLPPAEALQQNVTPTKAMELTTMGTTVITTENTRMIATTMSIETTTPKKKNNGAPNVGHASLKILLLVILFIVDYRLLDA